MKGSRSNYACRQKIYDAEKEPVLAGLEEVADFQIIQDWEKTTETGDRAEIKKLPENSSVWAKMDARGEACTGQKCPQFERCFITKMHQKASESDLIIVNHHLFFADLAVKEDERGAIIPDYAAVIFDEAHRGGRRRRPVLRRIDFQRPSGGPDARRCVARASQAIRQRRSGSLPDYGDGEGRAVFWAFGAAEGRTGFRAHEAFLEQNDEAYRDVLRALELVTLQLELVKAPPDEALPLVARAREMARKLQFWMEGSNGIPDKRYVYWIERRGRRTFLQATPIEVSQLLDERLFDRVDSVILTSATLAVAGSFDYTAASAGLAGSSHRIGPEPFRSHEAGAVVRSAESARPAQSGVYRRSG